VDDVLQSVGDRVMEVVEFKTSSYTCSDNCVEVAVLVDGQVLVRDSKNRDVATLSFSALSWSTFIAGVHRGDFDRPGAMDVRVAMTG
jgi:Domain of unknown function (DUF397)